MKALGAALVLLGLATVADAHSTRSCLNSAACKAAVEAAVAAAKAEWEANQPCPVIARSAQEAAAFVGQEGPFCVVIQGIEKCGDDYCSKFEVQP